MATYRIITNEPAAVVERQLPKSDPSEDARLSSAKALTDFCNRKDKYFQISRECICRGSSVTFSIYKQKGMNFQALLRAGESSPVAVDEKIHSLILEDAACEIVINDSDKAAYQAYLEALSDSSRLSEPEQLKRKGTAIKENSKMLMKDLLADPRSGEKIKEAGDAVANIADSIIENKDMIFNMLSLSKYDYYTYTHCVNVAVLSIGMGIAVGLKGEKLRELGIGAMLHDVGKTAVPPEILNKQGKLDAYEYRRIQEHVKEGELLLRQRKEFPDEAYGAVLEHHEKMTGTGYPNKLSGREIGLYGRITGIADCYDALTTQRAYKKALTPFESLRILAGEKDAYDPSLLSEFVKMLGKTA